MLIKNSIIIWLETWEIWSVASGYNKNKDAKIGRETEIWAAEQPEVVIHSRRDRLCLWRFLDLPSTVKLVAPCPAHAI